MIYDLNKIMSDCQEKCSKMNTLEAINSGVSVAQLEALLAIAERLEALVEAQKPRLVHLEAFDDGEGFLVNPTYVVDVSWRKWKDGGCVGVVTDSCDYDRDEHFRVKGTLAEVMAKLRGDK